MREVSQFPGGSPGIVFTFGFPNESKGLNENSFYGLGDQALAAIARSCNCDFNSGEAFAVKPQRLRRTT